MEKEGGKLHWLCKKRGERFVEERGFVEGFLEEGEEKLEKGGRFSGGYSGAQRGMALKEFKSSDTEPRKIVHSFGSCLRSFTSKRNGLSCLGCCLGSIAFLLG